MRIRPAVLNDCQAIAELALMAGEGIPGWFWAQSKAPGQSVEEYGALKSASDDGHFSYRNVRVAELGGVVAGMLLAYRLPDVASEDPLDEYPPFIRPLIELERSVPGSFYINMLATYPEFRRRGVGAALMLEAERMASVDGCSLLSLEVFEQNRTALHLYEQLGFELADARQVIPHDSYPYTGRLVLLTRTLS